MANPTSLIRVKDNKYTYFICESQLCYLVAHFMARSKLLHARHQKTRLNSLSLCVATYIHILYIKIKYDI